MTRNMRSRSWPLIVTAGHVGPSMGSEYMLRALPVILDGYPRAEYVCVGPSNDDPTQMTTRAYVRSLGRLSGLLGVEGSFRVVLDEDGGNCAEAYAAQADVCVFPYVDGCALETDAFTRAFLAGRTIVVTALGQAASKLSSVPGVAAVPPACHKNLAAAVLGLLKGQVRLIDLCAPRRPVRLAGEADSERVACLRALRRSIVTWAPRETQTTHMTERRMVSRR